MNKILLLLLVTCSACKSQAGAPQPPQTGAPASHGDSAATVAEIRRLVGAASCSSSTQCRTLPVGARPCGGPDFYLAWSSPHPDEASLLALAEHSRSQRKAEASRTGELSTCQHIPDPGAVCVAGACRLATPASAS
ncbi:hypothetical protein [Massilia sp. CFBP9026]|uniref:hypothetical protein n=1 Tax=Massilia sp. CFBP9026 TaxID=3096536 RepID=UPI002A6A40AD|nr:hypothetical protein [Massilia sp. CFBP9026]MDY0964446.1 hypothetical protein [Massilia sp. CFBP9026]